MTEKDYHYVFIFLTIYFEEFLHFSEKKCNDILKQKWLWNRYLLSSVKYIPSKQNHGDPGIRFYNDLLTCRCACDALKGILYEFKFTGK